MWVSHYSTTYWTVVEYKRIRNSFIAFVFANKELMHNIEH